MILKHLKIFMLRMIPVFVLVSVTIIMSLNIYAQMIHNEEEICWNRLEIATNSTSEKIRIRISDNLNFLTAVADAYTMTHRLNDAAAVGKHLSSVMEQTIFGRIDVILPDNTLITQEGEKMPRGGLSTFEELVAKGTHITQRRISSFTGEPVICGVTPIEDQGVIKGLLVGTISCKTLSEIFEVFTYGKEAQLFLIDRADGSYLMDNWHEELGNIYERGLRKSVDSEEMVDFVPAIIGGEYARFSYISQTNGEPSYQYCAPVEAFNWEVCVVVQEDVVFANVEKLENKLLIAGLIEIIVLIICVLWNIGVNIIAVRSENKVKQFKYEEAKNQARATFLSNMSHDIKTPLNGIVGMLQIIKNHRKDENMVDDCLQKIETSAEYLSTLTSDILYISEIENDKLVLPKEQVDLRKISDDLSYMMERQAKEADVSYFLNRDGLEEPFVLGSNVHIKRILVNLIGNAIKYSKNAGKTVWVTIYDEPLEEISDKRMYHFVIKDNGIGMSEEFQKNMYKAFEQEAVSARSEYEGYGLGLTIVNHLIKKMEGTIALESEKGVGSTFTVSIPFRVESCKISPDITEAAEPDISGLRILLVEDNEFNMEIAKVLLTDAGAIVDTAENGKIATELFADSAPGIYDAIIMDVMMPVMDGCEATKVIRNTDRPDARSIPIIAMTANTFSEDILRCKEAGMDAHVPKPLDMKALLTAIVNCRMNKLQ